MGPDCGTAIVGGIGLGFSHTLPPGRSASSPRRGPARSRCCACWTTRGAGVSAALGVGGRDLSAAVGGRSARPPLAALDDDPGTELILVISKPPAAEVASALRDYAAGLATPVQFALIAPGEPT